ncbi:MAG: ShlB/FhaC/HecB family hemolysin secretion/activation protein [Gammaproteobacteria bacterium]|nr:ShlB/FhaC/HecB family hemolysin secretion/activation protein [Gammaproteobacteria bacterium]
MLAFSVKDGARAAVAPPAAAPAQTFNVYEFLVLGSHALGRTNVEATVYPFLGPGKTIKDVEQARAALVAAYRKAGYGTVLVDIPEQTVDQGVVRLKVTEGYIDKVRITGARYYSEGRILSELPALKPGTVPRFPALQAQLARLASEAPDRHVTPLLVPGSRPGTVSVDLKVKDRIPVHGSLQVDNRYTSDTAHIRLTGTLSYNNLFQDYQTLSLQYQTAPADSSQVKLWVASYQGLLPATDWSWSVYGIRSDSNVAAIGTLAVIGRGKIIGGRLTRSLLSAPGRLANLTFGVDYKDFGQNIEQTSALASATPIHYILWSAQISGARVGPELGLSGAVGVNFGVRGVGSNDAEFEYKRYEATASYAYLHGTGNVDWRLWRGFGLSSRLSFQYSEQPLVNNEQFSLGGMDTVRGYLEAEELADSGVAGSLELHSPPWVLGPSRLDGYLFYDRGMGMIQDPLTSEITSGLVRSDLESYGVGFHETLTPGLDADVLWAIPLLTAGRTRRGDGRADFSVLYEF